MPPNLLDSNKTKVGDVILIATGNTLVQSTQEKLEYKDSSLWTHVAGSIGGVDIVEGKIRQSRVCSLQRDHVEKGFKIKVLRPSYISDKDRIKVALWWAAMNNLPYYILQLAWFPFAGFFGRNFLRLTNLFNSTKRLICSELIANGFYKKGYNFFDRPAENILPADFDNVNSFQPITDIWLDTSVDEVLKAAQF